MTKVQRVRLCASARECGEFDFQVFLSLATRCS